MLLTVSAQSGGEARVPDNNTETTERPEAEGTEAWRSSTGTQRTQTRYIPMMQQLMRAVEDGTASYSQDE